MAESVDTSGSAASSGDDSLPLAASASSGKPASPHGEASPPTASSDDVAAAQRGAWQGRVDFYILEGPSASARLKLACKLAEKAYLSSQSVLVWHTDPAELKAFDDMLWTFSDGSFVPHEPLTAAVAPDAPILLSAGTPPSAMVDIIINLAPDLPPCLSHTSRVAEIIDGDDARRRAGRARFKAYRELGVQPASHNIRSD
ncbi:MAG: polymerase chi subunit HolC [Gammaproteobacteria bacterium]|nr:polymerase chi subunit HolC [Gammaproteobacteria bacterium]